LKGTIRGARSASLPRQVLVVVQFVVSVVLICGTIVVYKQIRHASNRPVGYDREGIITVPLNDPNYADKHSVLKNELLATGAVSDVAFSTSPLTAVWNNWGGFNWAGKDPELASDFSVTTVSHDFGKVAHWTLIDGREFSEDHASDSAAIIINETAANYLNLKKPVGEYVKNGTHQYVIIGVIKDMIMGSPYEPVRRGFFFLDFKGSESSMCNLRIKGDVSAHDAIPKVEAVFKKLVPSAVFDFKFVDKQFEGKFTAEVRIGKLASVFAVLAIFISCLGLFGLASFVAERRTKEIGIRKVMGASVFHLWKLLSKDFATLVIISVVISIPIAYYLMSRWLENYKYHTDMSWWVFTLSGVGALLITLSTVSYQSIKAAMQNPVNSLRSE
jgi:ABC-type antimicrobial peptide transport system permease subunit